MTTLASNKSGWYFRTATLKKNAERYEQISKSYQQSQQEVTKQIVNTASSYIPLVEASAEIISEIDVIVSLAHAAATAPIPYTKPKLTSEVGDTILKGMRHPCIEIQDSIQFIANDVELRRGSSEFIIITGPNMVSLSFFCKFFITTIFTNVKREASQLTLGLSV